MFQALFDEYAHVTGCSLDVKYAVGDADDAQFNGYVSVVRRICPVATDIMCFFHVMMNVRKRARQLSESDCKLVYKHVYRMHHTENESVFSNEGADEFSTWRSKETLRVFSDYFAREWLSTRFHRWQRFHTAIGHATTNNPVEQFNQEFKRDYTLQRLLPLNSLMGLLEALCKTKATITTQFASTASVTPDLPRRLRYLTKASLLSYTRIQRSSLSFTMQDEVTESHVLIRQHNVKGDTVPLSKVDEARIHSLYMEAYKQPQGGCLVDVIQRQCPCKWWLKFGAWVHLVQALQVVGASYNSSPPYAAEIFVSRRHGKRGRTEEDGERQTESVGRPRTVGPALSFE